MHKFVPLKAFLKVDLLLPEHQKTGEQIHPSVRHVLIRHTALRRGLTWLGKATSHNREQGEKLSHQCRRSRLRTPG
jgi:hypothetical protein